MALGGDLRNINLADIFQTLSLNRQVGTLVIRNGVKEKRVYFSGTGVSLCSGRTIPGFRLGRYLVGTGRITEEDLKLALEEQRRTGDLLGKVLVDLELCTADDVETVIRYHAAEELYEIFGWDRGEFQFLEGSSSDILDRPSPFALTQFDAGSIVMEAARRIDEWERVRESLPSDSDIFVHTGVEGPELDPEEWGGDLAAVYALIDGKRNIGEVLNEYHLSVFDTGTILRELVLNGLIRVCDFAELTQAAWALIDEKDFEAACRVLERAHGQEPHDVTVLQQLIDCYERLGEKRAAAAMLRKVGIIHLEESELVEAIHALEKAEKYDPGNEEVPVLLLRAYREDGDLVTAAEKARTAASIYFEKEDHERAIELCQEGLEAAPGHVGLRTVLANAYLASGRRELSLRELEGLAVTLEEQRNLRKLEEIYKKILQLDSSRKEYLKRLQDLKEGAVRHRKKILKYAVIGGAGVFLLAFSLLLVTSGTSAAEKIGEAQRLFAAGDVNAAYDLAISVVSEDPQSEAGLAASNLLAQIQRLKAEHVHPQDSNEAELVKRIERWYSKVPGLFEQQEFRKALEALLALAKYMKSGEYAALEARAGAKAADRVRKEYEKSVRAQLLIYSAYLDRKLSSLQTELARHKDVKPIQKLETVQTACTALKKIMEEASPEDRSYIIGAAEVVEGLLGLTSDRVTKKLRASADGLNKVLADANRKYHVLNAVVRRHEMIGDFTRTRESVGDLMNEGKLPEAQRSCREFLERCAKLRGETPLEAYADTVKEVLGDDRLNLDGQIQTELDRLDKVIDGIQKGEALIEAGRYEEANALFREIIRHNFKIDFSNLIGLVLHLRTRPDGATVTMTPQGQPMQLLGKVPPEGLLIRYPPYGITSIVIRLSTFEKVEILIRDFQDEQPAAPVIQMKKLPLWHKAVEGAMEATPLYYRGKVILPARDGHVRLFKAANGDVIFDYDTGILNGFSASPRVLEGKLILPALDGRLLSVDTHSGKTLWKLPLGGKLCRNPVLSGETLVLANAEGTIFGIRDRAEVWRKSLGARVQGELAVHGESVFVATTAGDLHRLSATTGDESYRVHVGDRVSSTPVVDGAGRVFLGTDSSDFVAIRAEDGEELWRFASDNAIRGPAALLKDRVFFATLSGTIYQLRAEDGTEVNRIRLPDGTPVETGLTAGVKKVYAVDSGGVLRAICPDRGVLWSFDLGGHLSAPPLFAEGCLYLGTESGDVYCFRE